MFRLETEFKAITPTGDMASNASNVHMSYGDCGEQRITVNSILSGRNYDILTSIIAQNVDLTASP